MRFLFLRLGGFFLLLILQLASREFCTRAGQVFGADRPNWRGPLLLPRIRIRTTMPACGSTTKTFGTLTIRIDAGHLTWRLARRAVYVLWFRSISVAQEGARPTCR